MDNKDNDFEKIMEQVRRYVDERLGTKPSPKSKSVYLNTRITREQNRELEDLKFIYELRSGKKIAISDIIRQELEKNLSLEKLHDILPTSKKEKRNVIFNIRCTQELKERVLQLGKQLGGISQEKIVYTIILHIFELERRGESAFADYIKSLQ